MAMVFCTIPRLRFEGETRRREHVMGGAASFAKKSIVADIHRRAAEEMPESCLTRKQQARLGRTFFHIMAAHRPPRCEPNYDIKVGEGVSFPYRWAAGAVLGATAGLAN